MAADDSEVLVVYGPYKHGARWRIAVRRGRGRRRPTIYRYYETEAEADAAFETAREETAGMTIRKAVTAYLDDLRENERADATIESAEDRLTLLLGLPKNANKPLRWLMRHGAELYKTARAGKASDTHINALFTGKTWGTFLVDRHMLRANPFASVKPVGRKRKGADKERLTIDESRRLRLYCLKHGRQDPGAVLTLGYLLLGARASELVKRDIRDLDDEGRVLRIGATKTDAGRRGLAVPPELADLLIEIALNRPHAAPLFATDGVRWTRFVARDHVRRVTKAAGVPQLPPQALRRTQSDLATDAGVAALAVAAHLGHAGTAVTHRSYVSAGVRRGAQSRKAQLMLGTPLGTRPERPKRKGRR